jgi:hypothetical protein
MSGFIYSNSIVTFGVLNIMHKMKMKKYKNLNYCIVNFSVYAAICVFSIGFG